MADDAAVRFADRAGGFYAREYGIPPVAGRLIGYLAVCDPPEQTIADLAEALLASRSAITGAVKLLEGYHGVRRTRSAGDRVDHVSLDPAVLEPRGFAPFVYQEMAALAREGLELLKDASPARRAILEDTAALGDFLAERMPALLQEWHARRDALRTGAGSGPAGAGSGSAGAGSGSADAGSGSAGAGR
jgi:DNA-binding transcriptional regulator GbsR (MarR family)